MATTKRQSSTQSLRTSASTKSQTSTAANNGTGTSNREALRRLYASLLRIRLVQERASKLRPGTFELSIGDEAVVAGATIEVTTDDTVVAGERNLGVRLARGCSVEDLFAMDGQGAREVLCRSLRDDPFNLATGLALTHKLQQKQHVTVAFCQQERPDLTAWRKALKIAASHKLPLLYVVRNVESSGLQRISFMARDSGLPGIVVDGQDAVAVWRVSQEALHRARNGGGATLMDCVTDGSRNPLDHLEHYMRKRHTWDDGWRNGVESEIEDELRTVISA